MIAFRVLAPLCLASLALAGTTQCNTGSAKCCDSTQTATEAENSGLLSSVGLNLGDVTGLLGVNCDPLDILALGASCNANQEPVCCTGNTFGGLVTVGCSPININT
ncbi:fungal hydrophobin [Hygrophoropsis aurantiaca]|uniref:Fungal hydrophobin n=1 Tax=Hygrophoropsis aurantiaca TaxID=72124 RepID=A0ACB8AHH3_9AGAM|nr:fungal hydrophobin [Hygrophoropsis aurantiaca]